MRSILCTTFLAAAVLCFAAFSQEKASAPKKPAATKKAAPSGAPPMPQPAPEMKDLDALVGTWTTEEHYDPSPFMPTGGTGTGTNTVRRGPGGFTMLMDHRSKTSTGTFNSHGVLTWDPNEKAYKTVWADSTMPGVTISTGHKEGDNIVYRSEVTMEGKKISTRDVVADRTPTSYTLTSYMNDGSGEKKTMTLKFTRQVAAKPEPAKK
jgi:hypothetical protein